MSTPQVFSIQDAMSSTGVIDWAIEGVLPTGSIALMYGAPGSKKTYAALDLALCSALGKTWLGFPVKQGAVLIVDEESGKKRLFRRLQEAVRGHLAENANPPIFATSLHGFNFWAPSSGTAASDLQAVITSHGVKLVIIDALADVMLGGDENTVRDTQKVFAALRRIAEATGASIIVIHHSLKNGNGYRGSSAIAGALDLALEVESKPKEDLVQFRVTKARDSEPTDFTGECHWEGGQFWMTEATGPAQNAGHAYSTGERKVLNAIVACAGTATTAQIETATRYAAGTVRNIVSQLVRLGVLVRTDGGAAGAPGTYELDSLGLLDNPL